jgi:hypothetical protein
VVEERTHESIQKMVDDPQKAKWYFSHGFGITMANMILSRGKNDTCSVDGDSGELRHYLAHLTRKSLSFSRCVEVLRSALKLFVFSFHRRQLNKQLFPNYQAHVKDFVYRYLATPQQISSLHFW